MLRSENFELAHRLGCSIMENDDHVALYRGNTLYRTFGGHLELHRFFESHSGLLGIKCGNCKWWNAGVSMEGDKIEDAYSRLTKNFGACKHGKMVYIGQESLKVKDGLGYYDFEGAAAGIITGEDFGCIHYAEGGVVLNELKNF